jgi:hypothetical protein
MRGIILTAGAAAGLLLAAPPAGAQPNGRHPLDAGFTKWDKNKDGFLDADELAKAFRGPTAKAVEHKANDNAAADTRHPDHAFLDAWDADKDGRVSKAEFDKYEQKTLADLRAAANRKANYSPTRRAGYRGPRSHRGYSARGGSGRGYGTNPYTSMLRYQQRALAQQRRLYAAQMRYAGYSPAARGGYRGAMAHGRGRR